MQTALDDRDEIRLAIHMEIEAQGIRQDDIAQATGLHQSTISEFTGGRRDIVTRNASRLLRALGLKIVKNNQ